MTEVDLVNVLKPLVSNRVYPDTADLNTQTPFILYQQVGGLSVNYMESQPTDKKNARIQISAWCDTRAQAMNLIRDIENTLALTPIHATVLGAAIATYDDTTKMRGAIQDFSVWITH